MDFASENVEVLVQINNKLASFEPVGDGHLQVKYDEVELVDFNNVGHVPRVFEAFLDLLLDFFKCIHSINCSVDYEVLLLENHT